MSFEALPNAPWRPACPPGEEPCACAASPAEGEPQVRPSEPAPFEIWLVWSDRRLLVPAGDSTLKVLVEAGIPIDPGCLAGGCGSCATEYVEGDVVHKDSCLSAGDREHMFCPCVSRARGVLVLPF